MRNRTQSNMSPVTWMIFVGFLSALCALPANAKQSISLQDVLSSASTQYPRILEAKEKLMQVKASRLSAEGAFDVELRQQTRIRSSGFYDGSYANQRIIKPLRQANAKVFAEYRLSEGNFPVYEDEYATQDRGEVGFGLSFSLLRNRDIDPKRLAISNADLDITMEDFQQRAVLNNVLFDAALAYMEWLSAHQQAAVHQQLLINAKDRKAAIDSRIKLGYSARIDLLDNEQNVLKREAIALKAQNETQMRAIALSLYWRDSYGKPQAITPELLPILPAELSTDLLSNIEGLVSEAVVLHPDIQYVNKQILKEENNRQLYENELLPNVDIMLKASQDLGSGSQRREGLESYIGLEFSMALGQRVAKGKVSKVEAKLRELAYLRQRLIESLEGVLQQAQIKYVNAKAQAQISARRSNIAQRLLQQEQLRFSQGASDVFMLNLREEHTSEAQIDAITAELQRVLAGIELLGEAYKMDSIFSTS